MTEKTNTSALPKNVVYYNQWTDFESKEIGRLFECIPFEELVTLEKGATIWIDSEQPSGKVYGYNRAKVVSIEDKKEGYLGITFDGPYIKGDVCVEKKNGWHRVHRCTDIIKLIELINETPLATETGTVGTISDQSRKHLEDSGKVVVSIE